MAGGHPKLCEESLPETEVNRIKQSQQRDSVLLTLLEGWNLAVTTVNITPQNSQLLEPIHFFLLKKKKGALFLCRTVSASFPHLLNVFTVIGCLFFYKHFSAPTEEGNPCMLMCK